MGPTRLEMLEMENLEIVEEKRKLGIRATELDKRRTEIRHEIYQIRANEEAKKVSDFWTAIGAEFDMTNHPKFEKLKEKAWEHGHASGFDDVRNCFIDLLDIVK